MKEEAIDFRYKKLPIFQGFSYRSWLGDVFKKHYYNK